jgi:hypothetical protein
VYGKHNLYDCSEVTAVQIMHHHVIYHHSSQLGQHSVGGILLQGSNPGGGRDFPHPSRPAMGPTHISVLWVLGHLWGQSSWGMMLATHPHVPLRLKKGRAIPVPLLCAFLAGCRMNLITFVDSCANHELKLTAVLHIVSLYRVNITSFFISFFLSRMSTTGEVILKTMSDYWVVGKLSNLREFYVVIHQKNANLIEINGKNI